jgi:hypothetical protein
MSQIDNTNEIYSNNFNNINNIILYGDYLINNYIEPDDIRWEINRIPDNDTFNININEQSNISDDDFIPFEPEISVIHAQIDITVEEISISEEDKICCICIETREDSLICQLNCCHKFCYQCILIHTRRNRIQPCCPLCRTDITNITLQSEEIRDQFI